VKQLFAAVVAVSCAGAGVAQTGDDVTLDNGLRIVFVARPALPLVTFALFLRGGLLLDSPASFRHGSLALRCLWLGHGELDEDAVRGRLADAGAQVGSTLDLEDACVSLSCLAPHARAGIALFADALLQPRYDEAVVARERAQEQHQLAQRNQQPAHLAQEAFVRAVMGDHPLARAFALTDKGGALARADRTAMLQTWQRMVQPQLGVLFVVGRVTADVRDNVVARMQAWPKPRAATAVGVPPVPPAVPARVLKVPLPELTQVYVQVGMLGPGPQDARAAGVHVLRLALAGGFTSALTDELRVNRGLVYEISFTHPSLSFPPPYSFTTQTQASNVPAVLDTIVHALHSASKDGLTENHVVAARNLWLGTQAIERESDLGVAHAMHRSLRLFGDFAGEARLLAAVRGVTLDDVRAAALAFDPAHLVVVMVGAPEALAQITWQVPK
jgi:zinc protease